MKPVAGTRDAPGEAAHYRSLDGLRGLAAAMVAYGHAGYFGGAHRWVPPLPGSATIGVILFFFLSGFLMAHHYQPAAAMGVFNRRALGYWASFLLRRFVRVYPPYLFAPVVGYLLLMPRMPPDYEHRMPFADLPVFEALARIATFQGELGIYWTIEVELFFYLLYPLAIVLCLLVGRRAWTLLALTLALMVLNHLPHGVAVLSWSVPLPGMWTGYLSIFLAGAFAAVVSNKIAGAVRGKQVPWNGLALASVAGLALMVAAASRFRLSQESLWQLEWLFAALLLVMFVSLVRSGGILARVLASRPAVALGRASYSLYLMHIAAFYFAIDYLPGPHRGLLALLALLLLTPAFYVLFERPFVRLSKRIAVTAGAATARPNVPPTNGAEAPDR